MIGTIRLALTDVPEERFTTEGTSLSKVYDWIDKQKEQMCKDCPNRKQQFCERNYIKGFNAAIERVEVELQAMRKKEEQK